MLAVSGAYLVFMYLPFFASLMVADELDQKLAALTLYLECTRMFFWVLMVLGMRK